MLAGGVLFVTFFALAEDRWSGANDACPTRTGCGSDVGVLLDEGRAFEAATNVSWIASLSFAALGVSFLLAAWL